MQNARDREKYAAFRINGLPHSAMDTPLPGLLVALRYQYQEIAPSDAANLKN